MHASYLPRPTRPLCRLEARGLSRLKALPSILGFISEKRGAARTLDAAIAGALEDEQRERERLERLAEAARRRAEEAAAAEERRAELLARSSKGGIV